MDIFYLLVFSLSDKREPKPLFRGPGFFRRPHLAAVIPGSRTAVRLGRNRPDAETEEEKGTKRKGKDEREGERD